MQSSKGKKLAYFALVHVRFDLRSLGEGKVDFQVIYLGLVGGFLLD